MGRPLNLELIPICLGTHEAVSDCDGDPSGAGKMVQSCSWRERCLGFQRHLKDTGHDDERYIEIVPITSRTLLDVTGWKRTAKPVERSYKQFVQFTLGLARLYDIRPLRARSAAERPPPQDKTAPRKPPVAKRGRKSRRSNAHTRDKKRIVEINRLMNHFCSRLREDMGRKLNLDRRGAKLVLPGMMYMVSRLKKSGYVSVYCRRVRRERCGHDAPVVVMAPRYKSLTLSVSVPVDIRDIQRALGPLASTLDIEPLSDGSFKTVLKRLNQEQLELLSRTLAQLAEQGILQLPSR